MLRSWLALALALHVVFATSYAWCTPDFEGPDEDSHYEYAQHIANAGELPLTFALAQARGLPMTEGVVLAHHPPLYYALLAGVLVATGTSDTVFGPDTNPAFGSAGAPGQHLKFVHGQGVHPVLFLLRLVSVALGAITLLLVHRLGRACSPDAPRVADLAVLLIACLPMWSFLHGVLNNDVLATTLANACVLALVRVAQAERLRWSLALATGALFGLALLTKLTTLSLVPLALVAFVAVAWRQRRSGGVRMVCAQAAAALALALAICGWTLLRNHTLYGDWLALSVHDASFPPIPPEYRSAYFVEGFLPNVFRSLLGTFGWFSLPPHQALVWTARVVAGLALFGLLRAAFGRERASLPRPSWLLALVLVFVFAGVARFNWTAPQPQGRLLFPAVGAAAVLVAAGLVRASAALRWRRWLVAALPLTAAVVFLAWFRPAFAIGLAPAPPSHRSLVGGITAKAPESTINWRGEVTSPSAGPATLRWTDPGAAADARYTLYAYDGRGRVWLATHEWSHGQIVVQGKELALPEVAMNMLPKGVDLFFKLRRVPSTPTEDPATLPASPPLRFRRE